MRLTPDQAKATRLRLGMQSRNWMFGSRVVNKRRGGDVDLFAVQAANKIKKPFRNLH